MSAVIAFARALNEMIEFAGFWGTAPVHTAGAHNAPKHPVVIGQGSTQILPERRSTLPTTAYQGRIVNLTF